MPYLSYLTDAHASRIKIARSLLQEAYCGYLSQVPWEKRRELLKILNTVEKAIDAVLRAEGDTENIRLRIQAMQELAIKEKGE